jgi:hypothetical protein
MGMAYIYNSEYATDGDGNPIYSQTSTTSNFLIYAETEPTEKYLDTSKYDAIKNKDRLSKMGRSPFGPQHLHRKK